MNKIRRKTYLLKCNFRTETMYKMSVLSETTNSPTETSDTKCANTREACVHTDKIAHFIC